tara:strand:+ start:110 stop:1045 length:936 start_codon:yes stop_codon:yes gene_type:complete
MKALIISDGKPGHVNQSLALAKHLELDYDILNVSFKSIFSKVLSYLYDWIFIYNFNIYNESLKLRSSEYKIIISTGSSTFYANKLLKNKLKIKNIAILYPKGYRLNFNYIIAPTYDKILNNKNVIKIPINISNSNEDWFKKMANSFINEVHEPNNNAVGIIIGGPNEKKDININDLRKQIEIIISNNNNKEIWVTTSRRTTKEIENLLNDFSFDYKLEFSKNKYNPIPAFIELCDNLYITADSTTMISEAVSYGKSNVFIIPVESKTKKDKFDKFCDILVNYNAANFLSKNAIPANKKIFINKIIKSKIKI